MQTIFFHGARSTICRLGIKPEIEFVAGVFTNSIVGSAQASPMKTVPRQFRNCGAMK
jgi:hypothetical protein